MMAEKGLLTHPGIWDTKLSSNNLKFNSIKVMSKNITPIGDRVAIRPLTEAESATKSPAGIIIPDTVDKEKPEQGMVIAVGQGKWDEGGQKRVPMDVKVGDRVLFKSWSESVKIEKDEYWIISESDVLAVIS